MLAVNDQDVTIVGKITTAFGIKGWVKVYSFTEPMKNILNYKRWLLKVNGQWKAYQLRDGKPQGKGLVAALQGVDDRDEALALSQVEIAIPSDELPQLENDEFYWFQLEGLKVVTLNGQLLGKVSHLFNSGAPHDVLTVKGCEGSVDQQERLIPYVEQTVKNVDLEAGEIQVDWEADY
jgi:16S rRNA processing protein RimM